jgi:malate dehydrogenase (oxaloacetate-decarboxylating)(NADP+)
MNTASGEKMENDLRQADLREAALEYHSEPTPGKIAVQPTKGLNNQLDLALAYSPGVAFACHAIVDDPVRPANIPRAPIWSA